MLDALHDTIVLAAVDCYDRSKATLNYQQFIDEIARSIDILREMTAALPHEGPLQISYQEYVGNTATADLLRAVMSPFSTIRLDERYRPYPGDLDSHDKIIQKELGADYLLVLLAMRNTLLYPFEGRVLEALSTRIPYQFPEEKRFRGQFIVGRHGTGKTTYLNNLIYDDIINYVGRDQGSVIVIDSQNELIPQLAYLKLFAPGEPLHDRLIYIEPDPSHPLALNILDTQVDRFQNMSAIEHSMVSRGALQLINFFITSVSKNDTTPHMDTILAHVVPAAMSVPHPTIFTLQELMEGGYERFKHYLNVSPEEHAWLANRLNAPEYKASVGALRARLDGFTSDPFFREMFRSPRTRLDLFSELQSSKLILINTNKAVLKGATPDFGRFFIAKLLQATEERMLIDRDKRRPVFLYVDEAADYIAREENIVELINKARKQRVALTFAVQSESDIHSASVLSALNREAIQVRLSTPGTAQVALDGQEFSLTVPNLDLTKLPTMSKTQWHQVLEEMHERYCVPMIEATVPTARAVVVSEGPVPEEEDIRPVKDW